MSPGMASRGGGGPSASSDGRGGAARPTNISPECRELLPSAKLSELMQQVAPGESLDADVEEFLQEHIDDFVDSVTEFACLLAKHRKSRTVEARDLQAHLEKKWNIRVPGYGDDPRPPAKRNAAAPVHNARMQAIAKSQAQHHRANPPAAPRPISHHSVLPQQRVPNQQPQSQQPQPQQSQQQQQQQGQPQQAQQAQQQLQAQPKPDAAATPMQSQQSAALPASQATTQPQLDALASQSSVPSQQPQSQSQSQSQPSPPSQTQTGQPSQPPNQST